MKQKAEVQLEKITTGSIFIRAQPAILPDDHIPYPIHRGVYLSLLFSYRHYSIQYLNVKPMFLKIYCHFHRKARVRSCRILRRNFHRTQLCEQFCLKTKPFLSPNLGLLLST